jgi:hypothetical protein
MDQTPFTPLILTFPLELLFIISLLANEHSKLTLVKTCKALHDRYKQYYEDRTAVVLCNPHEFYEYKDLIKAHKFHNGRLRLKFVLTLDSQISNCPAKILWLNGELEVPENLDCEELEVPENLDYEEFKVKVPKNLDRMCFNYLIGSCSVKFAPIIPIKKLKNLNSLSFGNIEKLKNLYSLSYNNVILDNNGISMTYLYSLSLDNVTLDNNGISIISEISLVFILLKCCVMTNGHLQKLFNNCTTLQEIQLLWCCFDELDIEPLPPQLRKFKIQGCFHQLDASKCTQLESL